jgi:lipoyl-dependent peroxiredoxin
MVEKIGSATWHGDLASGYGQFKLDADLTETKSAFSVQYDENLGTNPEAMLGASQAGCYSLVLSMLLSKAGYMVDHIDTRSVMTVGTGPEGYGILGIKLITHAQVADIAEDEFEKIAIKAKGTCLICKALSAVDIELDAHLIAG